MKYLLLTLLVLFIAVAIGSLIVEDTGYVQLAISGWKIETNLIVFSSTLTLVFIAVYILIRSFIRTWRLPADLRASRYEESVVEQWYESDTIRDSYQDKYGDDWWWKLNEVHDRIKSKN